MTVLDQPVHHPRMQVTHGLAACGKRRPRVVIGIPCLLVGGTEIHTLALATVLHSAGFEVSVICYHEYDPTMVESFRDRGIIVDLLKLPRSDARWSAAGASALATAFARTLVQRRPDIAHIQYMTPGLLPVAVARTVGVRRVIATVHVTADHYGRRRWLPRHVVARACDAFLCVSKTAESSFFGGTPELYSSRAWQEGRRHFAIHNCVDLSAIDNSQSRPRSMNTTAVVGIVGRLHPLKGHDILLAAMALIVRRFPTASLLCVGDGEERDALRLKGEQLQLARHITWAGRVRPEAVSEYLQRMDIVAMPSRLEGFGLAAAEAMAHSKAIVASNIDGLAEVVGRAGDADGAGGLLVPAGDSAALAAGITHLLEHPEEREALGAVGRRRAERLFSMDVFAARHVELYETLLGANR